MERKKLIRISLGILASIVILIVVEVSIKGVNNVIAEKKKLAEIQKQQEIYENTPKYAEEVFLENVVSDFTKIVNQNDFSTLFEKLNVDYKDYKFNNSKEVFLEYIDDKFPSGDITFTFQDYKKLYGKYLCRILASVNDNYSSFQVLINQLDENGSYDIILNDMNALEKIENNSITKSNIKASLIYKVTLSGSCTYMVEYENIGNSDVNCTYNSIELTNTRGYEYFNKTENLSICLKPGEKSRAEYVFSGKGINLYSNTELIISLKDGNNMEFNFFLDED